MSGQIPTRLERLARHASSRIGSTDRYRSERRQFRALALDVDFETVFVAVTILSWSHFALAAVGTFLMLDGMVGDLATVIPSGILQVGSDGRLGVSLLILVVALLAGGTALVLTRVAARGVLEYLLRRRRLQIERTLPGAVRYLHVIASGSVDPRRLFESVVAKSQIHGATAESFERILRIAAVTGSVETGIRHVARDTPSKETLAPFLLTFLEKTREGPDATRDFLRIESRLLARGDERQYHQESRYMRTVLELFVLLLVVPVVLILVAVGIPLLRPNMLPTVPLAELPELTSLLAGIGSLAVIVLGGAAAGFAYLLRPSGHRWAAPPPASHPLDIIRGGLTNPTNTLVLAGPVVVGFVALAMVRGTPPETALVIGYVLLALPVGLVDVGRSRRRAEMDRRLPEFVHAVAGRLDAGMPFRRAVERVARTRDFGSLNPHVADLAFDLEMRAHDGAVRKRALERFIGRVGTSLAGRTIGLAVGALEAGADMRAAFATLQTETGRLAHAEAARRSRFPVVIAVGWTVALLIVAIIVTVNLMVLDSASPVAPGPVQGVVVDPSLGVVGSDRPLFYLLTQSTMLASGWFAGVAGRGLYEGLLHSGALVAVTHLVFTVSGLV